VLYLREQNLAPASDASAAEGLFAVRGAVPALL